MLEENSEKVRERFQRKRFMKSVSIPGRWLELKLANAFGIQNITHLPLAPSVP
jgi:hypothetical protein